MENDFQLHRGKANRFLPNSVIPPVGTPKQRWGKINEQTKTFDYPAVVVALLLMASFLSLLQAQRITGSVMKMKFDPPPRYSTRFVLHPERQIDGVGMGFRLDGL